MSVTQCLKVNEKLRAAGVTVREAAGWQSRGNGQVSAYEGGLVHHTATGYGIALPGTGVGNLLINGRPDLKGPLCNYAGNDDGSITVLAAHPANHAGSSGGRSMGPLPVTTLFNRRVLGLEIVYPGTSPMLDVQYRSALVWARAVADVVGGGDIERIRAHAETSITGKFDPGYAPGRTIDMAAFRAAARKGDDDVSAAEIMNYKIQRQGSALGGVTTLGAVVANMDRAWEMQNARDQAILAAIAADKDVTPLQITQIIDTAVAAHTPSAVEVAEAQRPFLGAVVAEAVAAALGADNTAQADAVVDEILARLASG